MDLKNKDLDEIAVESLRCKMTLKELLAFIKTWNVDYSKSDIKKINSYRKHIKKTTRSMALGY